MSRDDVLTIHRAAGGGGSNRVKGLFEPMNLSREFRSARFSPCRTWRYTLHRVWEPEKVSAMFIGLNPSTADEVNDDPTVRRCIRFARDWGYGGLVMMNAFAYRATDPRVMKAATYPVGPDNDYWLLEMAKIRRRQGAVIMAAWGNHGVYRNRHQHILNLFKDAEVPLYCLGTTKTGQPKHPLYVRADMLPEEFLNGLG